MATHMTGRAASASMVAAALLTAGLLAGCSGASSGPAVVQIGDRSISEATVDHWVRAINRGSAVGNSLGKITGSPRTRALDFLITVHWLIGEAAEQGLPVSDRALERGVKERMESVPGGHGEFEKELSSMGQTVDDVKLEVEAELAAKTLRELVDSRVPSGAPQEEVIGYYKRNIARYRIPEKRLVDLIESIPSRAEAVALGRRLGSGSRFSKRALHESVARASPAEAARHGNAELVRGIFAATPGKIAPPARFNGGWVLIVVRGRVPARTRGLKAVEVEIDVHLLAQRHKELFVEFLDAYRAKWGARTDCRPGFVVQKCSQYRGPRQQEENPLTGG